MIPVFNMSTADIASTLEVMRIQEVSYQCRDYLSPQDPVSLPVDATCRFKMTDWCYQVVDSLKYSRETVAISLSYLDRYLSSEAGLPALRDHKVFQLAAMTCLYTAIKIHEPQVMQPKVFSELSRGNNTEEQVTDMELEILNAIQWRMNPPTAQCFLSHFLSMLPEGIINTSDRDSVYDHANFQIQLAVYDYSLVAVDASTVAFAALMNALEASACAAGSIDIITMLSNVSCIDIQSSLVAESKDKLSQIVSGVSWTGPSVSHLNPKSLVSKPCVLRSADPYVSEAIFDGQPDKKPDIQSEIKCECPVQRIRPNRIRWKLLLLVVERMTRAVLPPAQ